MSIKFNCPHCQKTYVVPDDKAGLRTNCLGCTKLIQVPNQIAQKVDIEALAAAALAEEIARPEPVKSVATIDFNCPMCDEPVKISVELEGKQAPCPSCRRIIKVPLRVKMEPKDWRTTDKGLALAAKRDLGPAPEGEWGTATATSKVSRESLEEADAIPDQRPPLTLPQKIKRTSTAVAGLAALGLVSWWVVGYLGQNKQNRLFKQAIAAVDGESPKLNPEAMAEIHRAAGEFLLRNGKAELARTRFQKARGLLATDTGSAEREFLIRDVALAQVGLGGEKAEVDNGTRLKWEDTHKELRQVLLNLRSSEGQQAALRAVGRKLIERGQIGAAMMLASQAGGGEDLTEAQARIGLELLHAKKNDEAEQAATNALSEFSVRRTQMLAGAKGKAIAPPSALIALCVALGKQDKIVPLIPVPNDKKDVEPEPGVRLGLAEGLARKGELDNARRVARSPGSLVARVEACLGIAEALLDAGQPETARPDIEEAMKMLQSEKPDKLISPWLMWKLVALASKAGMAESVKDFTLVPEAGLRGRAQLEIFEAKLRNLKTGADEALALSVDKSTPAHAVALEGLARHNAAFASGEMQTAINGWEPETVRPFGYLGLALGLQDSTKRNTP